MVSLLAFSTVILVCGTGDLGNQPADGYSEGDEVFTITTNESIQVATTVFNPGDEMVVSITSYVVDLSGIGEVINTLYFTDYTGTVHGTPMTFNQMNVGGAHYYTQIITAPAVPDHYLLTAELEDSDGNRFFARDVLMIGSSISSQKYIKSYSDATYNTVDWTFDISDTVYLEIYSNGTPGITQSTVTFFDYLGGGSTKALEDLQNNAVTMNGDYARIQYSISDDLVLTDLTNGTLEEGYWYGMTVDLRRDDGGVLTSNWTIKIQMINVVVVEPTLSVDPGAATASPSTVAIEGEATTTLSCQFQDTDNQAPGTFTITIEIRDGTGNVTTLVDAKNHGEDGEFGGTLSVITPGAGTYTASYVLDPDSSFPSSVYDIYFRIEDGTGEIVEDGYLNNPDELTISSFSQPPSLQHGVTHCDPDSLFRSGEHQTTISARFSDSDSYNTTDFSVLFKIQFARSEIVLVDNKSAGEPGEFGDTLVISSLGGGDFTAAYTFDPDGSFPTGEYDLYFRILDQHQNSAEDGYRFNQDELEIRSTGAEPEILPGATRVNPNRVNRTGDGTAIITVDFMDRDSNSVEDFTVTFKIRSESGAEYVLVDAQGNHGVGEYLNTLFITPRRNNEYSAAYAFDPPTTFPMGNYSLYVRVEDENGGFAEDSYESNPNELSIEGSGREVTERSSCNVWMILAAVLVLVIVFFALGMFLRRGKGKKPSMHPKTTKTSSTSPERFDDLKHYPPSQTPSPYQPPPPPDYQPPAQPPGNGPGTTPPDNMPPQSPP